MIISAYILEDIHEIINWIRSLEREFSLFRGQSNARWALQASVGRYLIEHGLNDDTEKEIFSQFKKRSYHKLSRIPKTDFEWMMLCQHHWLPTRLLDWTTNPMVALYFAVCEHPNTNGSLFAIKSSSALEPESDSLPFEVEKVEIIFPYFVSDRQIAQSGCFTIHPKPKEFFNNNNITKIKISKDKKAEIADTLHTLGYTKGIIFPDMDCLAYDIKTEYSNKGI